MAQVPPRGSADTQPADEPGRSQSPRAGDDHFEEFQAGMRALAQLSTGKLTLEEMLIEVAQYAVLAIPGADGAGLRLMENNRSDTIVATADFVREVDTIQYSLGEGPCI